MSNIDTLTALANEARTLGRLDDFDADALDLKITADDGETVTIWEDGAGRLMGGDEGGDWPWSGSLADYLTERARTNNWS